MLLHPDAGGGLPQEEGVRRRYGNPLQHRTAVTPVPACSNKKDLIEQFVDSVSITEKIDEAWLAYIKTKKQEELGRIIAEEKLNPAETETFVANAFRDGAIPATGTAITKILPPVSRFTKTITTLQRSKAYWTSSVPSLNDFSD